MRPAARSPPTCPGIRLPVVLHAEMQPLSWELCSCQPHLKSESFQRPKQTLKTNKTTVSFLQKNSTPQVQCDSEFPG